MRERAEDVQRRAKKARDQAEEARGRSVAIDVLFRAGERDREAGGSLIAAALAFRFFLFMLPSMLLMTLLLSIFLGADGVVSLFGHGGITGSVATSLAGVTKSGLLSWIVTLVSAIIATAWTGWSLTKALNQSSRFAWRLPFRPLQRPLQTTGWCVGLLMGSTLLLPVLGIVHDGAAFPIDIVVTIIGWAAVTGLWALLLVHLTRPEDVPWKSLIPGAVAFGLAVQVMQLVTWIWISYKATSASASYGSLGDAVALLAWLAILGRVAIGSSVINATLWDKDHGTADEPPGSRP